MIHLLKKVLSATKPLETPICELCGRERKIGSKIKISAKGILIERSMGPKSQIEWKDIIQCDWDRKPNHLFLISRRGEMIHWEWDQQGNTHPSQIFEFLQNHLGAQDSKKFKESGFFKAS